MEIATELCKANFGRCLKVKGSYFLSGFQYRYYRNLGVGIYRMMVIDMIKRYMFESWNILRSRNNLSFRLLCLFVYAGLPRHRGGLVSLV